MATTSTLEESFKENPQSLQHILPIDFHSIQEVPNSHLWPNINNSPISHDEKNPNVPIIDLLAPNVVELIGHACKTWGIFQKVKVMRSTTGATGYGTARITPFFSKFMWHEGFTIMDSPLDHAMELWPHDHQFFCDVMENYQKEDESSILPTLAAYPELLTTISRTFN
ncbi:hypothetical protein H5410_001589 [Solanum commersonii]|uniref:Uncharacterized protein n=1 Tax=Solanum commersonii TaxID=4109 RepID=A0A9J6AZG7_SOLCO|nr:hypothetical protein H5410_001589 [Solanum commersonii]